MRMRTRRRDRGKDPGHDRRDNPVCSRSTVVEDIVMASLLVPQESSQQSTVVQLATLPCRRFQARFVRWSCTPPSRFQDCGPDCRDLRAASFFEIFGCFIWHHSGAACSSRRVQSDWDVRKVARTTSSVDGADFSGPTSVHEKQASGINTCLSDTPKLPPTPPPPCCSS